MAAAYVGMELGGGKVSMGVMDEHGSILARRVFSGDGVNGAERFCDTLCDHLEDMLLKRGLMPADVERIGIGAGGLVDPWRGVITDAAMFGRKEVPLAKLVEERVGVLPTVVQEGWAAAFAEKCFNQSLPQQDFVCITLGKGIGMGVVRAGQVLAGTTVSDAQPSPDQSAEVGIDRDVNLLEQSIGCAALLREAKERFPAKLPVMKASWRDVMALAAQGDAEASALVNDGMDVLSHMLAEVVNALHIGLIVVAGSLSEFPTLVTDRLREKVPVYAGNGWAASYPPVIRQAMLGADAAMVGAAFLNTVDLTA